MCASTLIWSSDLVFSASITIAVMFRGGPGTYSGRLVKTPGGSERTRIAAGGPPS
jgi:hypothetical protein